ncbi:hypothetical protein NPIL_99491 [Nephila pilipes]|uniref:Uncharacterized protein n=1 Tax=Nephila pilipes TaxID=299642 RepID=A0A8X6P4Y7_NEPPI|nr:hypothetical protein NPIL_99491 [Nephila pilipes]
MKNKGLTSMCWFGEASGENEISLLVSIDFYWSVANGFERLSSSLVAVNTERRWSLQEKWGDVSESISVNLVLVDRNFVSAEFRYFWELESEGIVKKKTEIINVMKQARIKELNE